MFLIHDLRQQDHQLLSDMDIESNLFTFSENAKSDLLQYQLHSTSSSEDLEPLPLCSTRTCSTSSIVVGIPASSMGDAFTASLLNVPQNILNVITMFLLPNELLELMCSGRKMYSKIIQQAQLSIALMAMKYFFGSEISQFIEYGDERDYLLQKTTRNTRIADEMKQTMIQKLRTFSLLKSSLQATQSLSPLSDILTDLRNPPMPTMKIRRENIGKYARSWFQNKLVEAYIESKGKKQNYSSLRAGLSQKQQGSQYSFEDSSMMLQNSSTLFQLGDIQISPIRSHFDLPFSSFMSSTKNLKRFSAQVADSQRCIIYQQQLKKQQQQQPLRDYQTQQRVEELLDAIRWYKEFDELATIDCQVDPQIHKFIDENDCVKIAMIVSNMFKQHCEVTREYLELNYEHGSYYDMISEYNLIWNTYQASIIEVQENLEEMYKGFEELYVSEMNVKLFPEYSLLRVASQHWSRIVLHPLKERLYESFMNLLQQRRNENLQISLTPEEESPINQKFYGLIYLPEKLSGPLTLLQQRLSSSPIEIISNSAAANKTFNEKAYSHFFSQNGYFVDNMLSTFSENIMDLSLNEASVHWLGHSEIQVGHLYKELHDKFLDFSKKYFDELDITIFSGFPIQWREYLLGELKYSRKIMKEITVKETHSLILDSFFTGFLRDCKDIESQLQQLHISSESLMRLSPFSSQERQIISEKLAAKGMQASTIQALLATSINKELLDAFLLMSKDEAEFSTKSLRDEDIEDQNRYCQITQRLDELTFAFYDLAHEVHPTLLIKMKESIKEKMQSSCLHERNNAISIQSESHSSNYHRRHDHQEQHFQLQSAAFEFSSESMPAQFSDSIIANSINSSGNNKYFNNEQHWNLQ